MCNILQNIFMAAYFSYNSISWFFGWRVYLLLERMIGGDDE